MNLIEAFEWLPNGSPDGKKIPVCVRKSWKFSKMISYLPQSKIFTIVDLDYDEFGKCYSKKKGTEKKISYKDFSDEDLFADDYAVDPSSGSILSRFDRTLWWDGNF